ncbi:MAG: hypothetical protein HQL80_09970 [Magnetococcales bacterium]|nr:hypothetical protein [Magnetococcales bacterium]
MPESSSCISATRLSDPATRSDNQTDGDSAPAEDIVSQYGRFFYPSPRAYENPFKRFTLEDTTVRVVTSFSSNWPF